MTTKTRRLAAILIALPLALAGCSSDGDSAPPPSASPISFGDLAPGQSVDRERFFEATKAAAERDKTYSFTFELGDEGAVMKASGQVDNHDPNNPKRRISGSVLTLGEVEMVVAGGQLYTKTANRNDGKYVQGPVADRVEQLLVDTGARAGTDASVAREIVYVGEEDVDGQKLRHFALYVDEEKASAAANNPSPASVPATTASPAPATSAATPAGTATSAAGTRVDYWLDDQNRPRKRQMTFQDQPATITYEKWGEPVDIQVPTGDQVVQAPGATPTTGVPTTSAAPPTS